MLAKLATLDQGRCREKANTSDHLPDELQEKGLQYVNNASRQQYFVLVVANICSYTYGYILHAQNLS